MANQQADRQPNDAADAAWRAERSVVPDQDELDRIWKNIKEGRYEDPASPSVRPVAVVDRPDEQVMHMPSEDRLGGLRYRRIPGRPWEEAPPGPPSPYR